MTELSSPRLHAADADAALEWLHEQRRTDGLPVVIPTPERVGRLLDACGRDARELLGRIGPAMGAATVETVVVNAVMAGCREEHLPVLFAAVTAVCDPVLDMTEIQSTTHSAVPLIIVNGPAAAEAGIAAGFGALGYGHRANLSIGRALRLCLINIGGGLPGVSDLALFGNPASLAYCLAEDEETSPLPPLHTTLGYTAEDSTVTVANVEAPHSVLVLPEGDAGVADRILSSLAHSLSSLGSNNAHSGKGTVAVLLNPDHARSLVAAGHTRGSIQQVIATRAGARVSDHRTVAPPSRLPLLADRGDDERLPSIGDPGDVLLVVAGGTGLYSMVMPSWASGPHLSRSRTVAVTR